MIELRYEEELLEEMPVMQNRMETDFDNKTNKF